MNKLAALLKCREAWLKHYHKGDKNYHTCQACIYHREHGLKYCGKTCIIKWPNHDNGGCCDMKSPYIAWCNATNKTARKHYALKVVNLIDKALIEIGG